jgi:hypothetical protein
MHHFSGWHIAHLPVIGSSYRSGRTARKQVINHGWSLGCPEVAGVHVLYKRLEIPANHVLPAIAVSVTYRKHEKVENPGSIPVSATMFS